MSQTTLKILHINPNNLTSALNPSKHLLESESFVGALLQLHNRLHFQRFRIAINDKAHKQKTKEERESRKHFGTYATKFEMGDLKTEIIKLSK